MVVWKLYRNNLSSRCCLEVYSKLLSVPVRLVLFLKIYFSRGGFYRKLNRPLAELRASKERNLPQGLYNLVHSHFLVPWEVTN